MGLIDTFRSLLGIRTTVEATSEANSEDLFGMSTAYITMEAEIGYEPVYEAGLCFSEFDSHKFNQLVEEAREIAEVGDNGSIASRTTDNHGYQWIVVQDNDYEELITAVYSVADEFIERQYGSRLLAAVFAFEKEENTSYWIYSFKRGSFYPFTPVGKNNRDNTEEFKLQSILDGELNVEEDEQYWYPMWPPTPGTHPWGEL